jgi:hypothetical protein
MQHVDNRPVYSPSDLNHFLECEYFIQLEIERDSTLPRRVRDEHADLLAEEGAEHERVARPVSRRRAKGRRNRFWSRP